MKEQDRRQRKVKIGTVVSNRMEKTVVVRVERVFRHSTYSKVVKSFKKYYAHNTLGYLEEGTKVSIVETRPLSKLKRWRVVSCL